MQNMSNIEEAYKSTLIFIQFDFNAPIVWLPKITLLVLHVPMKIGPACLSRT